jgi:phosphohistidine phosphatase
MDMTLPTASSVASPSRDTPPPDDQAAPPASGNLSAEAVPIPAPGVTYFGHPNREGLNVFLMRHASAGTRRVNQKLDVKRPLDKEGKRHCLQLAQVLSGLRISFDLIVSSPLKRCLQTAQLVGTEMGYEAKILHAQALEPNADFLQFQRLVHECRSYDNVLMVGHNPTMTAFLGQLIANNGNRERSHTMANVRLRKGAIARVTVERGPATLKWLLDPRLVRSLYATSTKSSRRKTSRK